MGGGQCFRVVTSRCWTEVQILGRADVRVVTICDLVWNWSGWCVHFRTAGWRGVGRGESVGWMRIILHMLDGGPELGSGSQVTLTAWFPVCVWGAPGVLLLYIRFTSAGCHCVSVGWLFTSAF